MGRSTRGGDWRLVSVRQTCPEACSVKRVGEGCGVNKRPAAVAMMYGNLPVALKEPQNSAAFHVPLG